MNMQTPEAADAADQLTLPSTFLFEDRSKFVGSKKEGSSDLLQSQQAGIPEALHTA
jgi:hypothetical protein